MPVHIIWSFGSDCLGLWKTPEHNLEANLSSKEMYQQASSGISDIDKSVKTFSRNGEGNGHTELYLHISFTLTYKAAGM